MTVPSIRGLPATGLFLLATFVAHAQWFDQGPVFSVTEENDAVAFTDRHYTQGIKFSYLHTDNRVPDWINKCANVIPTWGFSQHAIRIGTLIGQNIYTPEDLAASDVVTNDRPYAGWLYTGFMLHRRGLTADKWPTLESFEFDIGVVGPQSLAEEAQDWVHPDIPHGWRNQIGPEPGFAFKYFRAWLFSPELSKSRHFDFIPHAGFSLGNINTSFRAGGTIRLGFNLPDDFSMQTINSLAITDGGRSQSHGGRWGIYVYGNAEGSAVAYNEFIDGTLFCDSHHVTREPLVGELTCGGAIVTPYVEIGAVYAWRTREFTKQDGWDRYGSVYIKVKL